jgi:hypothetical protein
MAAGVEADAADAVVDGVVVAVGPVHRRRVAMGDAGGVVRSGLFVADPQRIRGVEAEDAMVFKIDLGHAVVGGGQEEGSGRSRFRAGRV